MNSPATAQPETVLINKFGDQYLPSINKNVFNTHGATHALQKQFKNELSDTGDFHIIVGTDSGLLIKFILDHGIPEDTRFLFIEPSNLIDTIRELVPDLEEWKNQLILCTPSEWEEKTVDLDIDTYIFDHAVRFHKSIAAYDPTLMDYDQLNTDIQLKLEAIIYRIHASSGAARFISHQLKIFSENITPAYSLHGNFKDKTCIILGGGPSLDEHMSWIKKNKDKLVIMAVSRLAKKLENEGLTPHMVFSVDPDIGSFDIGKELLTLPSKVLFVYSNHGCPELVSQWHGKGAYLGPRYAWKSSKEKSNVMPHGPTVTNTALMAAADIGFERILLAGVDLCYAKNGVTHTKGTEEADAGAFLSQDGQWVETYEGEKALTDIQLVHAIQCISEQGLYANKNNIDVINLSKTAAKIDNVKYIPPAEIKLKTSKDCTWDIIHRHIPDFDSQFVKEDNEIALKELEKVQKDVNEIRKLSKEALKINQSLFKKNKNNEYNAKFKAKIDKIQNKLNKKYETETVLLQSYGMTFFREFIKPAITDNWKDKELELSRKLYFEALIKSTDYLSELLDSTKQRTISRIDEESATPSMDSIIQQWKDDNQIGRAKMWIEHHPERYQSLSNETQQQLQQLTIEFDDIIANKDTDWVKMCKKNTTLTGVQRKADKMFLQRNKAGLNNLNEALIAMKENDEQAKSLHHLCYGYLLALNNEKESAAQELDQVGENEKKEQALKQILSLSIDLMNIDKAEETLEILSENSSVYTPHYAEILRLQNKFEKSIFTYTEYLKDNPEDLITWIALGRLYYEISEFEAASMVFNLVLEHDESNQAAQEYVNKIEKAEST